MEDKDQPEVEQTAPSKFQQWLDNLQQESWQLELLVSGFAIFLILGAYEPLQELSRRATYLSLSISRNFILKGPVAIIMFSWIFFLINLLLHVALRGLWISTLGLRYVSGDIDYDKLGYTPRFRAILEKRIGTFDQYIERLEKLCSVVFGFTFLTFFVFLSFGIYLLLFGVLVNAISAFSKWLLPDEVGKALMLVFLLIYFLAGLLYLIDFITLGWLKRKNWASRWYPPIYRGMSWITLSFIYRPLYYNLVDNRFGRWMGFLLVPYIVVIMLLSSTYFETHDYFPEEKSEAITFNKDYYEDSREESTVIRSPILPSPYVRNGFMEVFVPYIPVWDDKILKIICPGFEPAKSTKLRSDIIVIDAHSVDEKEKADSSFLCLKALQRLYVNDSLFQNIDPLLYEHPNQEERGLRTTIDVAYLPRGKHFLKIEKQRRYTGEAEAQDSLVWSEIANIPFWRE